MDNDRLNKLSEQFTDDKGESVIKRCFVFLCGQDNFKPNYLMIQFSLDLFGDPNKSRKVFFNFELENTLIEMCKDVIES